MENKTLLMATAMQIAARLHPPRDYRLRLVFLGGGTKPHLFLIVDEKRCLSFNIFAARLDRLDDERISDCDLFTPIFKGQCNIEQAAEQIAAPLGWEVTGPEAKTYGFGLYGLGLLLQRFAFDTWLPVIENGYLHGPDCPVWFKAVDEFEDCQGNPFSDEIASAYWYIKGEKGSAIFDLSEACVYLVGDGNKRIVFDRVDKRLLWDSINRIEARLRFGV